MKKTRIIPVVIIILLLIFGCTLWGYFSSLKKVSFTVKQPDLIIDIYKKENKEKITSFSNTDFYISLKSGSYYYIVNGNKINNSPQYFDISNSDILIEIDPNYSEYYLAGLLSNERDNIISIIKDKYALIIESYDISNITLFKKGEWCGAIIRKRVASRDIADEYRIILNKVDGKWSIIHYPEIVATQTNFPDVPLEILDLVNNLTAEY